MSKDKATPVVYPRPWVHGGGTADLGPTFSVMTYNILNDSCIRNGEYDYCDKTLRYMVQRHLHIKEEIRQFEPQVVCMQEINIDQHEALISPMMEDLGYSCVLSKRDLYQERHADAIFYKKDVFTLQTSKAVTLYDAISEEIKDRVLDEVTRAALLKHLMVSHQVVMAQLRHEASGKDIYVASIHIFWGELQVPDVQAAQACAAIRCLQNFMKGAETPRCILAGDFNTPPGWPAHQLIEHTGKPGPGTVDFLRQYKVQQDDGQTIHLVDTFPEVLDVTMKLKSTYKCVLGEEAHITSCDYDYSKEVARKYAIDYIWFSPDTLDVTAVLQVPPDDIITQETALPSSLFPSDHLPLVAKFIIK